MATSKARVLPHVKAFSPWQAEDLPDLSGKLFVITGANSGIGFEAAKTLAKAGGDIVLACRSVAKAEVAAKALRQAYSTEISTLELDLGSLDSVRKAADELRSRHGKIDALINNAGIMQTPQLKTEDGFELQVGTNHLGHFLWTGLLIDLVEKAKGRVVVVSSLVHKFNALNLEDYMSEANYTGMGAYTQSKLSNLMFAFELDKRLRESGMAATCIACHPGYSSTNLQSTGPSGFWPYLYKAMNFLMAQEADQGGMPTVFAAAAPEAERGAYYGPQKMAEYRGPVGNAKVAEHALNQGQWKSLWQLSESLVDFKWSLKAAS